MLPDNLGVFIFADNTDIIMSNKPTQYYKGRGAQINTPNKFHSEIRPLDPNEFDDPDYKIRTQYIETLAKSIVNEVKSPDVPMGYSLNPYQGCEHGCVYCYARNSHTYWGYSAGLDFETKIVVKTNAPALLRKRLTAKNWTAAQIMVSGNTDCYQPAEQKYKLTRQLLEVFLERGHPCGLITKNSLILRDMDLITELNKHQLISVAISINTLSEEVRSFMEPRTSTIRQRLKAVKVLSQAGVPVTVLAAPIVPGLTDHGIFDLVEACAAAGARSIHHIIVRLNGDVGQIFTDFIHKSFPDRADKILNQVRSLHGGRLNDSEWGRRMRGEGPFAEMIRQQFRLAKAKFLPDPAPHVLNMDLYESLKNPQLSLF